MNQIAVVNQGGKASAERVIVLPGEEFDASLAVQAITSATTETWSAEREVYDGEYGLVAANFQIRPAAISARM